MIQSLHSFKPANRNNSLSDKSTALPRPPQRFPALAFPYPNRSDCLWASNDS